MSFPRVTFVTIKSTDHIHTAIPAIKTTIETNLKASDGPPTLNSAGQTRLASTPPTRNGRVSRPILSPLPTSSFSFIFISPQLAIARTVAQVPAGQTSAPGAPTHRSPRIEHGSRRPHQYRDALPASRRVGVQKTSGTVSR